MSTDEGYCKAVKYHLDSFKYIFSFIFSLHQHKKQICLELILKQIIYFDEDAKVVTYNSDILLYLSYLLIIFSSCSG